MLMAPLFLSNICMFEVDTVEKNDYLISASMSFHDLETITCVFSHYFNVACTDMYY